MDIWNMVTDYVCEECPISSDCGRNIHDCSIPGSEELVFLVQKVEKLSWLVKRIGKACDEVSTEARNYREDECDGEDDGWGDDYVTVGYHDHQFRHPRMFA